VQEEPLKVHIRLLLDHIIDISFSLQ